MKIFVINHTQIFVDLASVCFWIWIADKRLRFLQTKHLQCTGKDKANPRPASCIPSHYRVSSCSLILMPSQTTDSEAKPRYVNSILEPHGQYSKISVRLLPCKAKPSYVYSILKPHSQSSKSLSDRCHAR